MPWNVSYLQPVVRDGIKDEQSRGHAEQCQWSLAEQVDEVEYHRVDEQCRDEPQNLVRPVLGEQSGHSILEVDLFVE